MFIRYRKCRIDVLLWKGETFPQNFDMVSWTKSLLGASEKDFVSQRWGWREELSEALICQREMVILWASCGTSNIMWRENIYSDPLQLPCERSRTLLWKINKVNSLLTLGQKKGLQNILALSRSPPTFLVNKATVEFRWTSTSQRKQLLGWKCDYVGTLVVVSSEDNGRKYTLGLFSLPLSSLNKSFRYPFTFSG